MPIRIIRASRSALCAFFLGLLVACAATDPAGPGAAGDAMLPEARLTAAEAAFERGDFPAGARLYREAAQQSDDERHPGPGLERREILGERTPQHKPT